MKPKVTGCQPVSPWSERGNPTNGRVGYTDGIVLDTTHLTEPQGKLENRLLIFSQST